VFSSNQSTLLDSKVSERKWVQRKGCDLLGGTGGASPIKKTNGIEAVEIIARMSIFTYAGQGVFVKHPVPMTGLKDRRTECLVLPGRGDNSWPIAPPTGFAVENTKISNGINHI
jgi:hypothetical protein